MIPRQENETEPFTPQEKTDRSHRTDGGGKTNEQNQ